jgi:hypothetical protein
MTVTSFLPEKASQMTRFFTTAERDDFGALGWDVCGSSAYAHFDRLGMGFAIEADGELLVQERGEDGSWRWVFQARAETPRLAACVAADFFYDRTGWELLSWRGPAARRPWQ